MKSTDWGVEITRVGNGYVCRFPATGDTSYWETEVVADVEDDPLKAGEELLWWIIDYFSLEGSRHDAERLTIRREPGDKHPLSDTEDKD